MNYFTPELLDAGNAADPDVADAAFAAWERAEAEYEARLKELWPRLPTAVRHYLEEIRLHDAEVIGKGASGDGRAFGLVLRPEGGGTVHLRYLLASRPTGRRWADGTASLFWQYDEIDVLPGSDVPVFVHRILFTGGAELHLPFYDFACEVYLDAAAVVDEVVS